MANIKNQSGFSSCGGRVVLKTVSQGCAYKIQPVVRFCKVAVRKVHCKYFCVKTVADFGANKNTFAKYQATGHVLVATVAQVFAQSGANIKPTP